jgi:hypothetical protein
MDKPLEEMTPEELAFADAYLVRRINRAQRIAAALACMTEKEDARAPAHAEAGGGTPRKSGAHAEGLDRHRGLHVSRFPLLSPSLPSVAAWWISDRTPWPRARQPREPSVGVGGRVG